MPVLAAAALAPLAVQPGSRVWVEGTSTVRSWRCETTAAEGSAAAGTVDLAQLASVARAEITIPIASLDCHNGTMNGHMRNALKAATAPEIVFHATSVQVTPAGDDAGTAKLGGTLSMGGVDRPVSIDASVTRDNGTLRVRGTKHLVMTEWGLHPPSLMLGTMKVNPAVTVGFDVVLKP
jgi:polyisoprenoid-binding protein YceI